MKMLWPALIIQYLIIFLLNYVFNWLNMNTSKDIMYFLFVFIKIVYSKLLNECTLYFTSMNFIICK